jgi:CHASE2 domain-containing sensor protein
MFADFEITDLVMSQLRVAPEVDEDLLVINTAYSTRQEMARMIEILMQHQPAVIGLDHVFPPKKTYSEDSLMIEVLKKYDNIVIGSELRLFNEQTGYFDTLIVPHDRLANHSQFGFVNLLTNASDQNDLKMCREFVTRQKVKGKGEDRLAFAVKLASFKDPDLTQKFVDRGNEVEVVNYRGNVFDYGQSAFGTRYFVMDRHEVFNQSFVPELIRDKVIIFCFLGQYLGDPNTREDKYFTPLNTRYVGKAEPDMFGGVIHANIVSMILKEDYINRMSDTTANILAVLFCLVNVFLFKVVYAAMPKWYDGITKLTQLVEIMFLLLLTVILFDNFSYKANFTLGIIVIALSGDSIEVYHGVVKNLFSQTRRRDLFKIKKRFWEEDGED